MTTTSLVDAKNRLSELIASVEQTHDRVIITKNGRPVAALVSLADLEGLEETVAILSEPGTAELIDAALLEKGHDVPLPTWGEITAARASSE